VDFYNHSELAEGILEHDYPNARPISQEIGPTKAEVRQAITRFDGSKKGKAELLLLLYDLNEILGRSKNPATAKYVALNLSHIYFLPIIADGRSLPWEVSHLTRRGFELELAQAKSISLSGTVEFRALRAQENVGEFIDIAKLLEARLRWNLDHGTRLIPMGEWKATRSPSKLVSRFRAYVEESGLDWHKYRKFVPSELLSAGERALKASPCKVKALLSD
jgi:hypothetical protein